MQLQAWFDGEVVDGLGWHLASCEGCFAHVEQLARLRNALRHAFADVPDDADASAAIEAVLPDVADDLASESTSLSDAGGERSSEVSRYLVARSRRRMRAVAVVPVAVVVAAGLVLGIGQVPLHGKLSSAQGTIAGTATATTDRNVPGNPSNSDLSRGIFGVVAGAGTGPSAATSSSGTGGGRGPGTVAAVAGALSLAVVVPTQGPDASEGSQVVEAVRDAVREADASGGVGGAPVQLTVVSAEDGAAVTALAGRVAAVVGGFGAAPPAGVPWILPADPWAGGASTMASELSPAQAGLRLGENLVQHGQRGTVGVVMGSGPDTALETGLAEEVPVTMVAAPASDACLSAATSLAAQHVTAIAIAGPPPLAASCASALGAMGWSPPNGMLVAPSAAYSGVGTFGLVPTTTLYTVLGLPWPQGPSAGAARFRSAVPNASSYRALVSFAATELAVQAARDGTLTMALLSGGVWRNDLYDFAGLANVGAAVVASDGGVWSPAP